MRINQLKTFSYNYFKSGFTNELGQVTFTSAELTNVNGDFTLTVTDVIEDSFIYDSELNVITSATISTQ